MQWEQHEARWGTQGATLALPTHRESLLPDTERLGKQVVERKRERGFTKGMARGQRACPFHAANPLPGPATLPVNMGLRWSPYQPGTHEAAGGYRGAPTAWALQSSPHRGSLLQPRLAVPLPWLAVPLPWPSFLKIPGAEHAAQEHPAVNHTCDIPFFVTLAGDDGWSHTPRT